MNSYAPAVSTGTRWYLYARFIVDCFAFVYLLAILNRQADKDWVWIPGLAGLAMSVAAIHHSKCFGRIYEWSAVGGAMILLGYLTLIVDRHGFIFVSLALIALALDLALVIVLAFRLVRTPSQPEEAGRSPAS